MNARRLDLRLASLLVVVALAAGCAGTAAASRSTPAAAKPTTANRTVTSSATGKATGVPDNLMAQVTVHTAGPSAAAVLADNSSRTQGVIDLLGAAGVSPRDVQTTSINLGPTFNKYGKINGYSADNSIRITFRDLKTAGARLDSLVGRAGDAVSIGAISLGFNNDDALTAKARVDAVRRARAQAEEMAKAAGATLGGVRTITEISPTEPVQATYRLDSAQSGVPVAAGSQDLSVQVKVVFELA